MPIHRSPAGLRRQRGFTLLQAAIVMLILASISAAAYLAAQRTGETARFGGLRGDLEKIETALVRYAALNQRLPCPASATAGTGLAVPAGATVACTFPNGATGGVVPWLALGLDQTDMVDAWGSQISYRVYTGATGLTRAGGINMRNCNTDATATGAAVADCAAGAPPPAHPDDFVLNKGLTVRDAPAGSFLSSPAAGTGAAFVLISHGADRRGGTTLAGGTVAAPAGTAYEFANADLTLAADGSPLAGGTYIDAAFDGDVDNIGADTHFDDVLRTITIRELADEAGLGPRAHGTPLGPDAVPGAQLTFSETDIGGFTATITSPVPLQALQAPDIDTGTPDEDTTVTFGSTAGVSRSCLWATTPFQLEGRVIRLYYEFSLAADPANVNGFGHVIGFLRGDTVVGSSLCGGPGANMGWRSVGPFTLPADRFGVEFDTLSTSGGGFNDPPNNHVAVIRADITHQFTAGPRCLLSAGGTLTPDPPEGCVGGPTVTWLEDGNATFHRMRIEVREDAGDGCGIDEAFVRAYVWENGTACTDCNDLTSDYAAADADRTVFHCAAAPASMDQVIVGLTYGGSNNPSTLVVRRFGVGSYTP